MKKYVFIIMLLCFCIIWANDQVTIYNDNFALVRSNLDLNLRRGLQDYYLDDIPSSIEANSIIIKAEDNDFEIFSQNYEYDLANTNKILNKYLNKEISISTENDNNFIGKLQFNDSQYIGILANTTQELQLINKEEIRNINLTKLPDNFFLKPTLHWKIITDKKDTYPVSYSYICSNMKWNTTYNAVWNEEKKILDMNSWVTIDNTSGKAYEDVKLKLVAGEVKKITQMRDQRVELKYAKRMATAAKPEFEEKAFHDFHLYTLSEKVTINNNQTKQITLFQPKNIKAKPIYEYRTGTDKVKSIIQFMNSKNAGLGIPLPKGIVKVYKRDTDDNLEFIGEDNLEHTPIEEEVKITTGSSFDVIPETVTLDKRKISRQKWEKKMKVSINNHSKKDKEVTVSHNLSGDWKIYNENFDYKKKSAYEIEFTKLIPAGKEIEFTWTEISAY
mgnify:CR=1 FL=1